MARRPTRKRRQPARRKGRRSTRRDTAKRGPVRRYWKQAVLGLIIVLTAYVFYLDLLIRDRFEGNRWAVPAHVFGFLEDLTSPQIGLATLLISALAMVAGSLLFPDREVR